jgi:hypothetical protein
LSSLELGLNKTVIITKEVAEDRKKKKKKNISASGIKLG